jgi:hypothetical protein
MELGTGLTVDIHFHVCGGMFNLQRCILAAIWLVSELASVRRIDNSSLHLPRIQLSLPKLHRQFEAETETSVPFRYFFNFNRLRDYITPRTNISVVMENSTCTNAVSPAKWATSDPVAGPKQLWAILREMGGSCAFLNPIIDKKDHYYGCIHELYYMMRLYFIANFGSQFLFFSDHFVAFAENATRKLGAYVGLHLRIEDDFAAYRKFVPSTMDFRILESCMRARIPNLQSSPIYIAAGHSVFEKQSYKEWRNSTSLILVNKTDVLPPMPHFLREDWAAAEALVLVQSTVFVGMHYSSLSWYVFAAKQHSCYDFFWNVECKDVLHYNNTK